MVLLTFNIIKDAGNVIKDAVVLEKIVLFTCNVIKDTVDFKKFGALI